MFPEWFRKMVLITAVFVIAATSIYFFICPPCYFCFGFKYGELCGEYIDGVKSPEPQIAGYDI